MAIYPKRVSNGVSHGEKQQKNADKGLGRGFDSLTGDNTPAEKKPLVVRRGAYPQTERRLMEPHPARAPKKTVQPPGVGGRVVIRTQNPPDSPVHSARSARKGTTVLIRTERNDPPKRYRVNERVVMRDPYDTKSGKPIVINPRKKK